MRPATTGSGGGGGEHRRRPVGLRRQGLVRDLLEGGDDGRHVGVRRAELAEHLEPRGRPPVHVEPEPAEVAAHLPHRPGEGLLGGSERLGRERRVPAGEDPPRPIRPVGAPAALVPVGRHPVEGGGVAGPQVLVDPQPVGPAQLLAEPAPPAPSQAMADRRNGYPLVDEVV